jgi:uncharacterized protein (TIGR02270 family)
VALLWDVHEEHLDEAAFLWEAWEAALASAVYTAAEVAAGVEERLAAHLDGLVLAGSPVAGKLLLPALGGDEPEPVTPATWALLAAEEGDHLDPVLKAMAGGDAPKVAAIARAMGLSRHPRLVPGLNGLWAAAAPALRAAIVDVVALRDREVAAKLFSAAPATDAPELLAAGLRLARRFGKREQALGIDVDGALSHPEARVSDEALATAFVLGRPGVWAACRAAASAPAVGPGPLALLAMSPNPPDRDVVRDCLKGETPRNALWALGFAGDVASADAAVSLLPDKKLGRLAAEAFSGITGLAIRGPFRVAQPPEEPEVGLDDPPPELRPEDFLPPPDPATIADWWRKNRGRFQPGQRYIAGAARTSDALRGAMTAGPTWRRGIWALAIAAETQAPVTDVRGWTRGERP